jgi:UDPglucose 6-dehydrogenase
VARYWEQVVDLNTWQQQRIAHKVVNNLFGSVTSKRLAVLGFAFKANTTDTREVPAIRICLELIEEGAELAIVDPKVDTAQIARDLGQPPEDTGEGGWCAASSPLEAARGADAVLILTEWAAYGQLDWGSIAAVMRQPAWLFDARAVAHAAAARTAGLQVWVVGS